LKQFFFEITSLKKSSPASKAGKAGRLRHIKQTIFIKFSWPSTGVKKCGRATKN